MIHPRRKTESITKASILSLGGIEYIPEAQEHIAVHIGCADRFLEIGVSRGGNRREIIEDIPEYQGNAEPVIHQVHAGRSVEQVPVNPGAASAHGKACGMPVSGPHKEPFGNTVFTAYRGGQVTVTHGTVIRTLRQAHVSIDRKVQLVSRGEITLRIDDYIWSMRCIILKPFIDKRGRFREIILR